MNKPLYQSGVGLSAWLLVWVWFACAQEEKKPFRLPPLDELGVDLPPLPQMPPPIPSTGGKPGTDISGDGEVELPDSLDEGEKPGMSSDLFPLPGEGYQPIFLEPIDFNAPLDPPSSIFNVAPDPWTTLFPDPDAFRGELPAAPGAFPASLRSRIIAPRVRIDRVRFQGNTAYTDEELRGVVSGLAGRSVTGEDLEAARRSLTVHYVEGGYVNSGARIPDQDLRDGELVFELVEGRLTRIKIAEEPDPPEDAIERRLRDAYIRQRFLRFRDADILNTIRLREALQVLQTNPNIRRINAELKPDANPGEAYLEIRVEEERPFHAGFDIHNARAPGVGAGQIDLWMVHTNLTGFSDTLSLTYGLLDRGFGDFDVGESENLSLFYSIPFTKWNTEFFTSYQRNGFTVIEEPFDLIDLTGESQLFRVGIRQPIRETLERMFSVSAMMDFRESQTYLFGEPFSLTPGAIEGAIDVTAFRFDQEFVDRSRNHVLALRSSFGFGFDDEVPLPGIDRNGSFFSWLGQGQYLRRLGGDDSDVQLVVRGNLQLTDSPMLAPEQLSLGGVTTVRGYRENQLVRDMGVFGSAEIRIPILYREEEEEIPRLTVAPFIDHGTGWNRRQVGVPGISREHLSSAGLGFLYQPNDRVDAELYWGQGFREFEASESNLQDHGIHFRISVNALER